MAWLLVIIAGLSETAWVVFLKRSQGFTRLLPSLATVTFMAASFLLLAWALRTIPVGTGYVVWTGVGAVGTLVAGILLFDESRSAARLFFATLVIAGIIGLHATRNGFEAP
ncbi:MAG: multidrug efflux SMR transporter [Planctomycetes bacterium]|nr:multidrug efflux SMR transporter [Planctomycetota bacterium]MCW8140774.1 multidrug efflux SMR transporter [Planctomycetota bacterium]